MLSYPERGVLCIGSSRRHWE